MLPSALSVQVKESGEVREESIVEMESVQQLKQATETLHNEGENLYNLEQYRQAVTKLLVGSIEESVVLEINS